MRPIILILFLFTICLAAVQLQAQERPNIVLVMTDDQGWADIGRNREHHPKGDQIQTPELDAISQHSLWFTRAYAAAPNCSPTRASLLTGRHPFRTGVYSHGRPLHLAEASIAEELARIGYATGHFGKWHLEGRRGPGIPVAPDDERRPGAFGFHTWASATNFYDLGPKLGTPDGAVNTQGEGSIATVELANAFIAEQVKQRRPFFAVIWTGSPHTPHRPAPEDLEACGGDPKLAEIRGIDRSVRLLREHLQKIGAYENTLLWFTSDNGSQDQGGTGGLRGKKGQIWEGGLRVPAFIHWPGRIKPGVSEVRISTTDIRPTLLTITGAKPSKNRPIDGIDISPTFDGRMQRRPSAMGFWDAGSAIESIVSPDTGHAAWLADGWKLHRINKKGGRWLLFHLDQDPQEQTDLAAKEPQRLEQMRKELIAWQHSVVASGNGADYQ